MANSWTIKQFEKTLNRIIKLDPQLPEKMGKIQGKNILLDIKGSPFSLLFHIEADAIRCKTYQEPEPHTTPEHDDKANHSETIDESIHIDLILRGSIFAFIALAKKQKQTTHMGNIKIEGDTDLAQTCQALAQSFQIDWEEQLSHFTGDMVAHRIGKGMRALRNWTSNTQDTLSQNINEYLHDEIDYFPRKEECEDFYQAIDTLRADTDRLIARVTMIKDKANKG